MPRIDEQLLFTFPKETVFKQITAIDFMKAIDSNFGRDTTILLQNERLMRSVSKVEGIGDVEIERITFPEAYMILIQRRRPMPPFIYQLSIQMLIDNDEGCVLKWINEFELDYENKGREATIKAIIKRNDIGNLQRMRNHLESCQ